MSERRAGPHCDMSAAPAPRVTVAGGRLRSSCQNRRTRSVGGAAFCHCCLLSASQKCTAESKAVGRRGRGGTGARGRARLLAVRAQDQAGQ